MKVPFSVLVPSVVWYLAVVMAVDWVISYNSSSSPVMPKSSLGMNPSSRVRYDDVLRVPSEPLTIVQSAWVFDIIHSVDALATHEVRTLTSLKALADVFSKHLWACVLSTQAFYKPPPLISRKSTLKLNISTTVSPPAITSTPWVILLVATMAVTRLLHPLRSTSSSFISSTMVLLASPLLQCLLPRSFLSPGVTLRLYFPLGISNRLVFDPGIGRLLPSTHQ